MSAYECRGKEVGSVCACMVSAVATGNTVSWEAQGCKVTIDKEQLFSRAFNARGGYLLVAVAMWWRR